MKISGAIFIKDGVKYHFPFIEAIKSIEPLCDEIVIGLIKTDDGTDSHVFNLQRNNPKIKIIILEWKKPDDISKHIYAYLTDCTLKECSGDWIFYIQADEILHEKYYDKIYKLLQDNIDITYVDGLLFHYKHFFGNGDYFSDTYHHYQNEIRVIKNNQNIKSYRDAQGFRKDNKKLTVVHTNTFIYHYGWSRHPDIMFTKKISQDLDYHNAEYIKKKYSNADSGSIYKYLDPKVLKRFDGNHPEIIKSWLTKEYHEFHPNDLNPETNFNFYKKRILYYISKKLNINIGEYKNYKLIK